MIINFITIPYAYSGKVSVLVSRQSEAKEIYLGSRGAKFRCDSRRLRGGPVYKHETYFFGKWSHLLHQLYAECFAFAAYTVWCIPEDGDTPTSIFNNGFLPAYGSSDRFYLCRNVRISLGKFALSSENRRVCRKWPKISCALTPRVDPG